VDHRKTGLIAASGEAQFTVHSILFVDTSLSVDEHVGWIHTICHDSKVLEDHLKTTAPGEVLVRHAVQGSPSTKNFEIHHVGYSKNSHTRRSVAPLPRTNEVEVTVEAFGLTDLEAETPLPSPGALMEISCSDVPIGSPPTPWSPVRRSSHLPQSPCSL